MKKTIIITGSSTGIGWALAEYFGKIGHRVYGLSRKMTDSAHFTCIPTDVTNNDNVQSTVEKILQKEKRIDLLVNNAGMGMVGAIEDAKQEEILQLFNLNLVGTIQMMTAVMPTMRQQKSGQIINISSIGSEMGLPFRGFYSASKSALDKVTEAMRYEVDQWNIQVCSLHLGDIKTNIADNRIKTNISAPYQEIFEKVYALMNAHVGDGAEPLEVAHYIDSLIHKKQWKAHYYFGAFGQKIGVPLKWFLPQNLYEHLMKKYNNIK